MVHAVGELARRAAEIEKRQQESAAEAVRLAVADQKHDDELDAATDPSDFPIPREEVISLSPELIIHAAAEPSAAHASPAEDGGEEEKAPEPEQPSKPPKKRRFRLWGK